MSDRPASRPDFERPEYKAGKTSRQLCYDLMEGSEAIRAGGVKYLPKWPKEKQKFYDIRAAISQVARYYQRTVQAAVGMICSQPPSIDEEAPQIIRDDWEDIDGRGTHGEVFARERTEDMINGGFCGILVDAPPIPEGLDLNLADEQDLGLRPFWVAVTADQIKSWIVQVPDWRDLIARYAAGALSADEVKAYAKQVITKQVVIHEPTEVEDGEFGVKMADRYRILRLTPEGVTWEVQEKRTSEKGEITFVPIGNGRMLMAKKKPFREIPLAVGFAIKSRGPFDARPPFLALAELNLDHYQVSADRRYLMRLCHAPTMYAFGLQVATDEEGNKVELEVGPNSLITSENAEAKIGYAAAPADVLTSSKEEKEDLVRQMATLGMSFLGKDRSMQTETATARALDDAAENASHSTVARGLQDLLEQAGKFHAAYRGTEAPSFKVNTTYAAPTVDPQIATVLWNAVAADKLDVESWVEYIKTGELPDDIAQRLDLLRLATELDKPDPKADNPPAKAA